MKRLLYTGSFDPITFGHLDIMERASKLADELIIGVGVNTSKTPWFSIEERMAFIADATKRLSNVRIIRVDGITANIAMDLGATLVRGIRNGTDLDREKQIDCINKELHFACDTLYLLANDFGFISSSAVREICELGGTEDQLSRLVPYRVVKALIKRQQASLKALRDKDDKFPRVRLVPMSEAVAGTSGATISITQDDRFGPKLISKQGNQEVWSVPCCDDLILHGSTNIGIKAKMPAATEELFERLDEDHGV